MPLPKLKISRITNLQDARYCAAEGVHFLSFSLERGYDQKLSVQTVWNIANWLEGPAYIIELNTFSLDELKEVSQSVSVSAISLPIEDWAEALWMYTDSLILRATEDFPLEVVQDLLQKASMQGKNLQFEISCEQLEEVSKWEPVFPNIFLHFKDVDKTEALINLNENYPFGISLGSEVEEAPGMLDYDKTGKILSVYQEKLEMANE
ncbi:MAG: hypothetical protein AAF824_04575 [Bacteroidota bacterium]